MKTHASGRRRIPRRETVLVIVGSYKNSSWKACRLREGKPESLLDGIIKKNNQKKKLREECKRI
jgi:hypothetical protein